MKKVLFLLSSILLLSSCSETEPVIYDPNSSQGLLYFSRTSAQLAIEIDATGSLVVPINVSNLSDVDRVVTIEIDEDQSTADPQNYTLQSTSITIPAGEYAANVVLDGVDVTAETDPELLVLRIVNFSDESAAINASPLVISVVQVCPIPEGTFVGNYLIEEITPLVDGPTLDDASVVEVVRVSNTRRRFATRNYPNYCSPTMNFNFELVCGDIIVAQDQRSTCACSADGLFFGPAITPSTYDVADDTTFDVTFTNDVTSDCPAGTAQTTYRFTKQ